MATFKLQYLLFQSHIHHQALFVLLMSWMPSLAISLTAFISLKRMQFRLLSYKTCFIAHIRAKPLLQIFICVIRPSLPQLPQHGSIQASVRTSSRLIPLRFHGPIFSPEPLTHQPYEVQIHEVEDGFYSKLRKQHRQNEGLRPNQRSYAMAMGMP